MNPKEDKPPDVFFYWMDMREFNELRTINGTIISRGPRKARVHYILLRRNYQPGTSEKTEKHEKYRALHHELRHAIKDDGGQHLPGTLDVDTDKCTKRRDDLEEQARGCGDGRAWGAPGSCHVWENVRVDCTVTTRWDCTKITFDGIDDYPDHPDNPDPSGDSKQCGLIYVGELQSAYFVCKGAPLTVCLPRREINCRRSGGGLGDASCAVPDADARRPRSGIRAAE